jgi:hypothetical protein
MEVEPLLHSELLSDGLVDCRYPMPLASRRARRTAFACMLVSRRPECHIRVDFGHTEARRARLALSSTPATGPKGPICERRGARVTAVAGSVILLNA